ncbi:MAG: oligosaccharide repeat unit polymerase [Bacteroides sp.]|nr:oligosaccharide repeat unit polymerase [Bacteroides sp.]MBD5376033.1 oligosaccharide repeat unit polymerase [Bacteroides sp.]
MTSSSRKYIPFHLYLFLFGAIYYWLFPVIILDYNLIEGMPGVSLLDKYNYKPFKSEYIQIVSLLIISYTIGCILPLKFKRLPTSRKSPKIIVSPRDLLLFSLPVFLFGQYTIFKARNILFKGYSMDYDIEILGAIATANSIFLVLLLFLFSNNYKNSFWSNTAKKYSIFGLIEFSIILLGLGSRMYVMIPATALFIYYLQNHRITRKLIFVSLSIVLLFLWIGIWRISNSGISWELLFYIGSAEPLLTWISAVSFFSYNQISWISIPQNFLSSFINFIPTFIFPSKGNYIIPFNGIYDSPLGATNLITSLLGDFGLIGSCLILMLLGFILTLIQYNWTNTFGRIYYYCLCGIIPFQLFRDNLPIINKVAIFNMLIVPILTYSLIHFISRKYNNGENRT